MKCNFLFHISFSFFTFVTMKRYSIKNHFKKLLLAMLSALMGFVLFACDKEEPDPPIVPMYGVQAVEYEDVRMND